MSALNLQSLTAGGNISVQLGTLAAASKFAGKIQTFFDEYLTSDDETGTVPFGGRDHQLAMLDRWLSEPAGPARLVLAAPAGRGKSALLARWIMRLKANFMVGDCGESWQLVFVPISIRFRTNAPEVFYEAIAARLAEVLRQDLRPAHVDPVTFYEDQCALLANEAVQRGTRVLIVLDGLDEALGESFDASWFPRAPGQKLKLVVSARLQLGDRDAADWVLRLGWGPTAGRRVQLLDLPPLGIEGVRDLLLSPGAFTNVPCSQSDLISKIYELAEGEPLLLRFIVEDLRRRADESGQFTARDLNQIAPGFSGYFNDWLDRQRKAWQIERQLGEQINETAMLTYLAILGGAYGPLSAQELGELGRRLSGIDPGLRLQNTLHPLRRFIIGTRSRFDEDGYVLCHPKFAQFLREDYFDKSQMGKVRQCFANWGRDILTQLNASSENNVPPAYLLQYFSQHLEDISAAPAEFMSLVEGGWLRAWFNYEGGYTGFSRDVQRVINTIEACKTNLEFRIAQLLRCQLVLASIRSIGYAVPDGLIEECLQKGVLSPHQALHLSNYQGPIVRTQIMTAVALQLSESESSAIWESVCQIIFNMDDHRTRAAILATVLERAPVSVKIALIAEARQYVSSTTDHEARAKLLSVLVPHLSPDEKALTLSEAVSAAKSINNILERVRSLVSLVPRLEEGERNILLMEELSFIQNIRSDFTRGVALGEIAEVLPGSAIPGATSIAMGLDSGGWGLMNALGRLGRRTPAHLLPDVLDAISAIESDFARSRVLADIMPCLPRRFVGRARALADTLSPERRGPLLAAMAMRLPAIARTKLLDEAVSISRSIPSTARRATTLLGLLEYLPQPQQSILANELHQSVATIQDDRARAYLLRGLARYVPEQEQGKLLASALAAGLVINDHRQRSAALAELGSLLPEPERSTSLKEALHIAERISDNEDRASALAIVAKQLPYPEKDQAIANSLTAACLIAYPGNLILTLQMIRDVLGGPAEPEVLRAIGRIPDERLRSEALVALADKTSRCLIPALLAIARSIQADDARIQAMVACAPCLSEAEKSEIFDSACAEAERAASPADRVRWLLNATAVCLAATRPVMLKNAAEAVRAFPEPNSISHLLTQMAGYATGAEKSAFLAEAITAAETETTIHFRVQCLADIVKVAPPPLREIATAKALSVARMMRDDWSRTIALEQIARVVPEEERASIIAESFSAAQAIHDPERRAERLGSLMGSLPLTARESALHSFILLAGRMRRDDLLRTLSRLGPVIARTGGLDSIRQIQKAIRDTGSWLP